MFSFSASRLCEICQYFPLLRKKCGTNHVSVLFLNPPFYGKGKVSTPEYLDFLTP
ncbi:hypothetical protein HMPREF9538_02674 [Klebsiella sp. MS 92-3]|nr:hypothetical protein HMPREF9538_02674 [Klebsiella sp. MS 92-3]BAH60965.1 hypothetical protein KP1_0048 [Klebsiella pneumoniae subsp. pneumoniae NTUH-K2044]